MRIGLLDIDGHSGFPNFALCKISAYWKKRGAEVEWYYPFGKRYDIVYCSKVFTFTPDYEHHINADEVFKGGTGYSLTKELPLIIENMQPDLSLYPKFKSALGFLTRGCIRRCSWCVVPKKEGDIRPYTDIKNVLQDRKSAILMDNNVLACDWGISQIEKIGDMGVKVDFNQGLDARLVTPETAKLLAKVKWIRHPRFSCDTIQIFESVKTAIELLRKYNYKGEIFVYVLLTEDIRECYKRIMALDFLDWTESGVRMQKIRLFAQPYIDYSNKKSIPKWQQDMARWVNNKKLFYSDNFENYEPRKGFKCKEYFK